MAVGVTMTETRVDVTDELGARAVVEMLDELPIQPSYFQQRKLMARLSKSMTGSERLA